MLNQLQFKLQVEEQYRKGIEKMAQLYRDEGDRRLKNETESKKRESENKIQLLKRALKRYETLRQFETAEEDEGELSLADCHALLPNFRLTTRTYRIEFLPDGQRKENLRKPLAGKLIISLKMARDLNHVPLSRKSSKVFNETTVVIKIEGNERGVSHPCRNDKWYEEFDLVIDKANEIELTIYDTQNGGDPTPIGMLWLRVSEVVEALRRQKVEADTQGAGWVPAATAVRAATIRGPSQGPSSNADSSLHREATKLGGSGPMSKTVQGIDGWFAVEPAGAVALHLDFGKFPVSEYRLGSVYQDYSPSHSQGECQEATFGPGRRSWSSRCRAKEAWRRLRNERSQIRPEAILSADSLRSVSGILAHWRRLPVRGLSLCLPQKVLPESGHQMHFQVERGYCESTSGMRRNLESMLIVG
jgi:hypothetical protein